jgi:hypothetical protein
MVSANRKHNIITHTNFICLRDSFCNTHNKTDLIFNSFNDGVSSGRRRDIEDSCIRFCCGYGLNKAGIQLNYKWCKLMIRTSRTVPKTGSPRCVCPAFFGETPPTMLVPYANASVTWKVPYNKSKKKKRINFNRLNNSNHCTVFPVKPWHSTLVSLWMRRFLMVSA